MALSLLVSNLTLLSASDLCGISSPCSSNATISTSTMSFTPTCIIHVRNNFTKDCRFVRIFYVSNIRYKCVEKYESNIRSPVSYIKKCTHKFRCRNGESVNLHDSHVDRLFQASDAEIFHRQSNRALCQGENLQIFIKFRQISDRNALCRVVRKVVFYSS